MIHDDDTSTRYFVREVLREDFDLSNNQATEAIREIESEGLVFLSAPTNASAERLVRNITRRAKLDGQSLCVSIATRIVPPTLSSNETSWFARSTDGFRNSRYRNTGVFLSLAFLFVSLVPAAFVLHNNISNPNPSYELSVLLNTVVGLVLVCVVAGIWMRTSSDTTLKEALAFRAPVSWIVACLESITLLIALVAWFLVLDPQLPYYSLIQPSANFEISILFALLCIAIIEEIVLRGFLYRLLRPYGETMYAGLPIFLGGIAHSGNVKSFVLMMFFGLMLTRSRRETGTLYAPIILHTCFVCIAYSIH